MMLLANIYITYRVEYFQIQWVIDYRKQPCHKDVVLGKLLGNVWES